MLIQADLTVLKFQPIESPIPVPSSSEAVPSTTKAASPVSSTLKTVTAVHFSQCYLLLPKLLR